jgi:hypothetical protein
MRPIVLRSCAMLVMVLSAAAPAARAQLTEAQPGARVRVQAPGIVAGRYVGTVLVREPGMIRIGAPDAAPIDVPIDRITSLEISKGSSRLAGAGRGMKWGTAIGLGLGVVVAATSTEESRSYWDGGYQKDTTSKAEIVAWSVVAGALWGAGIGALFPKEHWERFDLAPRTGFDDRRRRVQLGFRVAY